MLQPSARHGQLQPYKDNGAFNFQVVGKEKRRFARQPTLQTAHVRFGEGPAIPSEIRDYCQNGLYVAFLEEGVQDAALPSLVGTSVRVEFSVAGSATYGCNGRVARVSPAGSGYSLRPCRKRRCMPCAGRTRVWS